MVTAAYSSAATAHSREPWFSISIAGFGYVTGGTGRIYKLSTYDVNTQETSYTNRSDYLPWLRAVPRWAYDSINPADGSSDAGVLEFEVVDKDETLSAFFAYLRGGAPVTGTSDEYPTIITEDLDRTETGVDVNSAGGVANNEIHFVNNEAMLQTGEAGTTLTVTRAQLDTLAERHTNGDELRKAPINPRGLLVRLYRNFMGLAAADESQRWTGLIRDIKQGESGQTWVITAESVRMLLDVEVMRKQGRYRVTQAAISGGYPALYVANDGRDYELFADTQEIIYVGSSAFEGAIVADKGSATTDPFVLRSGASYLVPSGIGDYAELYDVIEEGAAADMTVWEVAPTNTTLSNTRFGYWNSAHSTFTKTTHPFRIALNWLLSRTNATILGAYNVTGSDNIYDVLPEGWGAEIPAALVNTASFERLAERRPLDCPNFLYGIGGRSFNLLRHLDDELLGPFGVHVVQIDGVLTLVEHSARPAWDTASAVSVTHAVIHRDSVPHVTPDLSEAITQAHIETGYDWVAKKFMTIADVNQRPTLSWALRSGRKVQFRLYGFEAGAPIEQFFVDYVERNRQAPGLLVVSALDTYEHQIDVGDTVVVTSSHLVDLSRGTRGVTAYAYICIGKEYDSGRLVLRLSSQNGRVKVASIAPGLRITDVVTQPTYDIATTQFTESGAYTGYTRDVDWFAVGDYVQCLNGNSLAVRFGTGRQVVSKTTNTITLSAALTGAIIDDYIVFDEYDSGNVTANQKKFAHYSTSARIGTSNDAPYIYVA